MRSCQNLSVRSIGGLLGILVDGSCESIKTVFLFCLYTGLHCFGMLLYVFVNFVSCWALVDLAMKSNYGGLVVSEVKNCGPLDFFLWHQHVITDWQVSYMYSKFCHLSHQWPNLERFLHQTNQQATSKHPHKITLHIKKPTYFCFLIIIIIIIFFSRNLLEGSSLMKALDPSKIHPRLSSLLKALVCDLVERGEKPNSSLRARLADSQASKRPVLNLNKNVWYIFFLGGIFNMQKLGLKSLWYVFQGFGREW